MLEEPWLRLTYYILGTSTWIFLKTVREGEEVKKE